MLKTEDPEANMPCGDFAQELADWERGKLLFQLVKWEERSRSLREGRCEIKESYVADQGYREWRAIDSLDGRRAKILEWLRLAQFPMDIASVPWVRAFINGEYDLKRQGGDVSIAPKKFIDAMSSAFRGGRGFASQSSQGRDRELITSIMPAAEALCYGLNYEASRIAGKTAVQARSVLLSEMRAGGYAGHSKVGPQLRRLSSPGSGEKSRLISPHSFHRFEGTFEERHAKALLRWWRALKRFFFRDPKAAHLVPKLKRLIYNPPV